MNSSTRGTPQAPLAPMRRTLRSDMVFSSSVSVWLIYFVKLKNYNDLYYQKFGYGRLSIRLTNELSRASGLSPQDAQFIIYGFIIPQQ